MRYFKLVYDLALYLTLAILGASVATLILHHVFEVYYV